MHKLRYIKPNGEIELLNIPKEWLADHEDKIRIDIIDKILDISWHSVDLRDFRREVLRLKEEIE